MKFWTGMSAGTRVAVVAGAGVMLAVVGYLGFGRAPEPEPVSPAALMAPEAQVAPEAPIAPEVQVAPEALTAATPEAAPAEPVAEPASNAAPEAAPEAAPDAAPEPAVLPDPVAPMLDVVRIAPDGSATVAGRADPGAEVSLRVDGAEVIRVTADAAGNFVALFDLIASELPRLLTVVVIGADGGELAGPDRVALAPVLPQLADTGAAVLPAPAAILVSPQGVKVLQPATEIPAEVAANIFVDTIAYTADGAVQLGGHGAAGHALRIYLDASAVAEARVSADGTWSVILPDVAAGIYSLRVDQLAEDGSVTSRFETPFQRETLEALAAASAQGPEAAPEPSPEAVPNVEPVAEPVPEPVAEPTPAPEPVAAAEPAPAATDAQSALVTVDSTAPEATAAAPVANAPQVAASDPAPATGTASAAPSAPEAGAPPSPAGLVSVTVQPGFTLWGIAREQFGEGILYVQVFDANREKIKDPDLIYPGQIFLIPGKN